jgi:hypothetical protein
MNRAWIIRGILFGVGGWIVVVLTCAAAMAIARMVWP